MYDGHGGHEVAAYCAQKLPDFLKETEAYKKGDLQKALIDAFLGFDATISTREVVTILKEIAGVKDDAGGDGNSEDDENVDNLYEEASMSIEQVMEKYQSNLLNPNIKKLQGDKIPVSPMLKGRKIGESSGQSSSSSSSSGSCSSSSGSSKESSKTESEDTSADSTDKKDSENKENNMCSSSACDSSSTGASNGEAKIEPSEIKPEESTAVEEDNDEDKKSIIQNEKEATPVKSVLTNGDAEPTKETTESLANGEVTSSPKGKGKAIAKKSPVKTEPNHDKNLRIRNAVQLYSKLLTMDEESETEDENDETFQGAQPSDTSGESEAESSSEGADDEDEDEDEEEEDVEEEEMPRDEDDDDVTEFTRTMTEEPGSDSGCTAVVALLRGNELYVANAGDSRCVVCRDGKAVDMSFDHKPEDTLEMNRVVNAGGKVTRDGRVNGGLNLSRAIGDHAYKQNKKLSDREQMITALPDIKTLTINPAEDEFMVLACDGIWNFMSSQEVVDFVRPRLTTRTPEKLSQICEEMFDHCLAPDTMGDGTGCDNMTACVIQFKNGMLKKRSADDDAEEEENSAKRAKTETTESASAE